MARFLQVTSQEISQESMGVDVRRDHLLAGVGDGRGAGRVRLSEAGAAGVGRAGGA
jgi:hypothetical protein